MQGKLQDQEKMRGGKLCARPSLTAVPASTASFPNTSPPPQLRTGGLSFLLLGRKGGLSVASGHYGHLCPGTKRMGLQWRFSETHHKMFHSVERGLLLLPPSPPREHSIRLRFQPSAWAAQGLRGGKDQAIARGPALGPRGTAGQIPRSTDH